MKKEQLIEICKKHTLPTDIDAVIREPYLPYIPDNWNGILILAEAQNLSKKNRKYVNHLQNLTTTDRFLRLSNPKRIGIQPWDDGSLKMALQSAFTEKAENTAVSNSVVWSQVNSKGNNIKPSKELIRRSSKFWSELLPIINPTRIITSGKIAYDVIRTLERGSWQLTKLRLPSRNAMSRISGMFPEKELLSRFPEVNSITKEHPEWVNGSYRQNKIFFASHAVATVKSNKA